MIIIPPDALLCKILAYRCDACDLDGETYTQGECAGKLFTLSLSFPDLGHDVKVTWDAATPYIRVDLCRDHVRQFRPFIGWGVMFCRCGGIVERTRRTRPIEDGEGVWEEFQCENYGKPIGPYSTYPHYNEWEPLD